MQFKAALFDLDDTLYTSWEEANAAAYAAAGARAEQLTGVPAQTFLTQLKLQRHQIFEELGPIGSAHNRGLWAQRAWEALGINPIPYSEAIFEAYWGAVLDTIVLRPEIPQLFADLHRAGVKICICTNMTAEIQLRKLLHLGIAADIDVFVSSEEAGADKPDPAIVHLALRKAGATAQQAVFIGDNFHHDVLCAAAAGVPSIWLNWTGLPSHPEETTHREARTMAEVSHMLLCPRE